MQKQTQTTHAALINIHIQWSYTANTANPDFKVTPLIDAEYLRNSRDTDIATIEY